MTSGIVFYQGPSVLDGKPIVGIATFASDNRKTGDMIQTWILRSRIDPVRALQTGGDSSICGDCYHRGSSDRPRTCYVNLGQAPLGVYRAFKRGVYPKGRLADAIAQHGGKPVRMGAYGDPVAVPFEAWTGVRDARLWTGYTHQWLRREAQPFRDVLMASCDSPSEMMQAAMMGWRTFSVTAIGAEAPSDSILCPSDQGAQCSTCGLCRGGAIPNAPSIYIPAHGTSKRFVGAT